MTHDLVLRAARTVTPAGETAGCVVVNGSVISAVLPYDAVVDAAQVVDVDADCVLLPGFVDTHVHINEPGRTEWEGFSTATRAAASGGITTLIDMPLNSVPATVDVAALDIKRKAADGQCFVDVGFWGGAIPGNFDDLFALHDAGVFGFKCFLLPSGVDEFPNLDSADLDHYLGRLAELDAVMIIHAEDPMVIDAAPPPVGPAYASFLRSRPRAAESTAIATVIEAARRTGARAHIVHLSDADALPMIATAKADGVRLTVETCPHYLVFDADSIPDGATQFKCCPPIREPENRERLWAALGSGLIDFVVSDHSPCVPELKAARPGRLRRRVGWDRVRAVERGGGVDAGAATGVHPRRRVAVDVVPAGRVRRPDRQGGDRGRTRRRLRHRGAGRRVHRRRAGAAPSQSGHAVRRPTAVRSRAADLVARTPAFIGRAQRTTFVPPAIRAAR